MQYNTWKSGSQLKNSTGTRDLVEFSNSSRIGSTGSYRGESYRSTTKLRQSQRTETKAGSFELGVNVRCVFDGAGQFATDIVFPVFVGLIHFDIMYLVSLH